MGEFVVGANLPWLDYGQDFGASAWQPRGGLARPERRERLRRALGDLAGSGASLVRWWLLGDGRAGLSEDGEGRITGLDDRLLRGRRRGRRGAARGGPARAVRPRWTSSGSPRAGSVNGVRLGGRRDHVRDPSRRARLLERVFAPIAERYGREAAVAGWDLMNEPEWATLGVGTLDPRRSVSRREMRAFLAETAAVFRARATQPLSVGLASARWLSLVDGLDLDQPQVHWYESLDSLDRPSRGRSSPSASAAPCSSGSSRRGAPPCRRERSSRWPARPATPAPSRGPRWPTTAPPTRGPATTPSAPGAAGPPPPSREA